MKLLTQTTNKKIIIKIIKKTSLNVQLGGGIRTLKQISFWIKNRVSTVVVGTMAIENPKILKKACSIFPGQIAVALDVRKNSLAMKGWVSQTKISIFDYIKKLQDFGVSKIIYTDIDRDGTKKGLNFKNINKLISITKIPLIVSGGVSKLVEVKKLKKLNLNGVIIGKAIYDRSLNLNYLIKI